VTFINIHHLEQKLDIAVNITITKLTSSCTRDAYQYIQ